MGLAAEKHGKRGEEKTGKTETSMDSIFTKLFSELCTVSHENASESVNRILVMSSKFMSKASYENLLTFRELYSDEEGKSQLDKESVNESVDDIFEQAQALAGNEKLSVEEISSKITEDESREAVRLGISGLQKKLETLISTEDLLKNKLAPIIKSMEFEKVARCRIQHVSSGFALLLCRENDLQAQLKKLHNSMTEGDEKETFEDSMLKSK